MASRSKKDRPEDLRRTIAEIEQRDATGGIGSAIWANAHIALGDYESALEFFESAIEENAAFDAALMVLSWNLLNDPVLDSDPRWIDARSQTTLIR